MQRKKAAKKQAHKPAAAVKPTLEPPHVVLNGVKVVLPESIFEVGTTLDALSTHQQEQLMLGLKLPVKPWREQLVRPVLMGWIQNAFYQKTKGEVPERCVQNQQARLARYPEEVAKVQEAVVDRKMPAGFVRIAREYIPAFSKTKPEDLNKQERVLFDALKDNKPFTIASVAVRCAPAYAKLGSRQKPEKIVAFYINRWKKDGLVKLA